MTTQQWHKAEICNASHTQMFVMSDLIVGGWQFEVEDKNQP